MTRYLVLGAGKFGCLALNRLGSKDSRAAFVVVDRLVKRLDAARNLTPAPVQWVEAEAVAFLRERLRQGAAGDWLIPAIPEHVAFAWLRQAYPEAGGGEVLEVPEAVAALTPSAIRGPEGELYLSRAVSLCPDDCAEPQLCPVTGETREIPLFEELAALKVPGFKMAVIPSLQLAPGVGGYPPARLEALAQALAGFRGKALIATACRCHGVVHALAWRVGG
jgi:hypothetical protein